MECTEKGIQPVPRDRVRPKCYFHEYPQTTSNVGWSGQVRSAGPNAHRVRAGRQPFTPSYYPLATNPAPTAPSNPAP
jgi:hypothetical protein